MSQQMLRAALASLFVVGLAVRLHAASLEEIEKKIIEVSQKVESYTADMTTAIEMDQAGMTTKGAGKGTMEFLRQGDKSLVRHEQEIVMTVKVGDHEQKMEQKLVTIIDGEFAYTLTENPMQKSAVKTRVEASQGPVASKEMFEALKEEAEIKVLDDEKIDGTDCHVLEITPKQKEGPISKMKLWCAKDSGITIRTAALAADGKPLHTQTLSNIKLNAKIDAERFKFKVPEGVQLIDMTAMGQKPPTAEPEEKE